METRVNLVAPQVAQSVRKIEKDLDTTQEKNKKYSNTIKKIINDVLDFLNSR